MKFVVRGVGSPILAGFDQLFEFLRSQVHQGALGRVAQGRGLGGLFEAA